VGDYDPGTLFVKSNGSALTLQDVDNKVETLTARYRGVRVNPHHFRDIFAYAWLDKNPDDYLTLSKMLWHRNITTTLNKYGKRYNESSAVCKTETWLELLAAARGDG
jgi:site-specific recombinase XerD